MLQEAMNMILHLPLGIKKVYFFLFASFFLLSLNWSQITVLGSVLSSTFRGEIGHSLSGVGSLEADRSLPMFCSLLKLSFYYSDYYFFPNMVNSINVNSMNQCLEK